MMGRVDKEVSFQRAAGRCETVGYFVEDHPGEADSSAEEQQEGLPDSSHVKETKRAADMAECGWYRGSYVSSLLDEIRFFFMSKFSTACVFQ